MLKKFANVQIVYICDDGDTDLLIAKYIVAKMRGLMFWRWIVNRSQTEFTLASEYGSLCFDVLCNASYSKGLRKVYRSTFLNDRFRSGPVIMELCSALNGDSHLEVSVADEEVEW